VKITFLDLGRLGFDSRLKFVSWVLAFAGNWQSLSFPQWIPSSNEPFSPNIFESPSSRFLLPGLKHWFRVPHCGMWQILVWQAPRFSSACLCNSHFSHNAPGSFACSFGFPQPHAFESKKKIILNKVKKHCRHETRQKTEPFLFCTCLRTRMSLHA